MTGHPNVDRIIDGYAAFAKGDFAALNDLFAEDIMWHEPGRNQLAGDFRGREAVYEMFGRLMEITAGSFHLDLQTVFANDERQNDERRVQYTLFMQVLDAETGEVLFQNKASVTKALVR